MSRRPASSVGTPDTEINRDTDFVRPLRAVLADAVVDSVLVASYILEGGESVEPDATPAVWADALEQHLVR